MAWLNAAPEYPPPKGKAKPRPPEQPRLKQLEQAGMQPVMPPMKWAAYIVNYLMEFGPGRQGGPIEAEHVPGIEHVLGLQFKPWEKRLLLRLSKEYLAEQQAATTPGRKPPWPGAEKQWQVAQQRNIDRKLDQFL